MYEMVATAIVGGIFSILSILLWQRGLFKKMELQYRYNIRRYKLGQRYKLKAQELPKEVKSTSWIDVISKLDKDKIAGLLELLPEEPEEEDLLTTLANFARDNPELVNSFLSGFKKKSEEIPPEARSY